MSGNILTFPSDFSGVGKCYTKESWMVLVLRTYPPARRCNRQRLNLGNLELLVQHFLFHLAIFAQLTEESVVMRRFIIMRVWSLVMTIFPVFRIRWCSGHFISEVWLRSRTLCWLVRHLTSRLHGKFTNWFFYEARAVQTFGNVTQSFLTLFTESSHP